MALSIPIWSDAFLEADIRELPEYKALIEDPSDFDNFLAAARAALSGMQGIRRPDEAITIERVIAPILDALGWHSRLPSRSLTSRDEVDLALFADPDLMEQLLGESEREQVLGATGIVECKSWQRDFDAAGTGGGRPSETAAQQIQRYLLLGGTDSDESLRWGILTNGARWRLYSYRTRPRERTWEIDLASLLVSTDLFSQVLEEDDNHRLRTAYLLLRRDSWLPAEGERESLLDRLLEQGRRRDADLADDLSDVIFKDVYPQIVRLFWQKQPEAQSEAIARAALLFLYRLLFIYYGEDRGMLNTEDPNYRPLSLRYGVRDPVAEQSGQAQFSTRSTRYWRHLQDLRAIIDQGEPDLGLTAYNGGLFADSHAILDEIELSDAELAPIIYDLSHTANGTYVSYRNLEVQQLGSIYERLLERVPRRDEDGQPDMALSPYARKDSGSYYTPQELVDLIVEQTLGPLVEERVEAFRADPSEANDPAEAVLRLRVLDPAMGSGHFLITAIDWLAERLVTLVNREWEERHGYVSPVREQLWELQDAHAGLDERTLLQRMVLKRCIYGVDKNPMAVELARVALWLHTFTGELPLPYLEHRIVEGDSLLGIRGEQARAYINEWGPYPLNQRFELYIEEAAGFARKHDALLDLTLEEIQESRALVEDAGFRQGGQHTPLNLVAGLRWLSAGMKRRERTAFHAPLKEILRGDPGRSIAVLLGGENRPGRTPTTPEYREIRDAANAIVERERILHWELTFPEVMSAGGFDAVIGNPPWEQLKIDEIEWWEPRDERVALAESTVDRDKLIDAYRESDHPLYSEFATAIDRTKHTLDLFRSASEYPYFGRGDINLYGLFVDRASDLLAPNGIFGLLVPSGVYAGKLASAYVSHVVSESRLLAVFDFENSDRVPSGVEDETPSKWFPDVHPQQRFCALVVGGIDREFSHSRFGFMLTSTDDVQSANRAFSVSGASLLAINPNTSQLPQFRIRKDAELIASIYERYKPLVTAVDGRIERMWPLKYRQGLFHSKRDADLFVTSEALDRNGAYRVEPNWFRMGATTWLPLYQGRMIDQYDHRANSISFNPKNTKRPYVSVKTTAEQHANTKYFAQPRHWVPLTEVTDRRRSDHAWAIGFRDISAATNERLIISTILPNAAIGDTVGLLLDDGGLDAQSAACVVANLNSMAVDYIAGRKIPGTHVKKYAIEQLPMITPADYDRAFGNRTARELVRTHVLELTYTAHDLTPFARDLGYEGDPYIWNVAERRQLRSRLDALYFHLYGLNKDDAGYILDQFPVLEKNERREFGHYLTKQLVLGQYRALAAGDTAAVISESAS